MAPPNTHEEGLNLIYEGNKGITLYAAKCRGLARRPISLKAAAAILIIDWYDIEQLHKPSMPRIDRWPISL